MRVVRIHSLRAPDLEEARGGVEAEEDLEGRGDVGDDVPGGGAVVVVLECEEVVAALEFVGVDQPPCDVADQHEHDDLLGARLLEVFGRLAVHGVQNQNHLHQKTAIKLGLRLENV